MWSFLPLSGAGAAIRGGRFNAEGEAALYLSLDIVTAVREANQGFAARLDPCLMCAYEVDSDDIADLRSEDGRKAAKTDMNTLSGAWLSVGRAGGEPPSWKLARRLRSEDFAGMLVRSFAPGAGEADHNLVLWRWTDSRPHCVAVHDPSGKLPRNQLSWAGSESGG